MQTQSQFLKSYGVSWLDVHDMWNGNELRNQFYTKLGHILYTASERATRKPMNWRWDALSTGAFIFFFRQRCDRMNCLYSAPPPTISIHEFHIHLNSCGLRSRHQISGNDSTGIDKTVNVSSITIVLLALLKCPFLQSETHNSAHKALSRQTKNILWDHR